MGATEEMERLSRLLSMMDGGNLKDLRAEVAELQKIINALDHRTQETDRSVDTLAGRVSRHDTDIADLRRQLQESIERITSKINTHMEAITSSIHRLELHDAGQAPAMALFNKIASAIAVAIALGIVGAVVKYGM